MENVQTKEVATVPELVTVDFEVNIRVNRSFSEEGVQRDEMFVTSDSPYVNYKFNLEGDDAGKFKTGIYGITFKEIVPTEAISTEPTVGETVIKETPAAAPVKVSTFAARESQKNVKDPVG